jgi:acetyl-CoA synthetase
MDDVLKVAGHRIGSAEIESALVGHSHVTEAAAIGIPDAVKGEAVVVFVTLSASVAKDVLESQASPVQERLREELKARVVQEIGALARPDRVQFVSSLPKTRSGKIMRRLLRELAITGEIRGDTSTLADEA